MVSSKNSIMSPHLVQIRWSWCFFSPNSYFLPCTPKEIDEAICDVSSSESVRYTVAIPMLISGYCCFSKV